MDDYYIVEITKAIIDKSGTYLIFKLKDDIGLFRFHIPVDNIVKWNTPLGAFLHLSEDKYLPAPIIRNIVSSYKAIDTYLVPNWVKYIPNYHKKRIQECNIWQKVN